jgi:iron-sulfur cluster repair protein YtfE (RIC family)
VDAFELLRKDHERARALFSDLLSPGGGDGADKFHELKNELEVHTKIEEDVLYPALEKQDETRDLVADSREEHDKAKQMLGQIEQRQEDGQPWHELLGELKSLLDHHMEEEEQELFPKARQLLSESEQDDIGARLVSEKQTLEVLQEPGKPGPGHRH